jgi:hypothetical protein
MNDKLTRQTNQLVKKGSDALDHLRQANALSFISQGIQESLVLMLDVSGSMGYKVDPNQGCYSTKCDVMKEAANKLILASSASMIGVVAFSTNSDVLCRVSDRNIALGALSQLKPDASTMFIPGLQSSRQECIRYKMNVNRVIIMSDGCAAENSDEILEYIDKMAKDGIIIDTVAFGHDADDTLLRAISDHGKGVYSLAINAQDLVKTFLQLEAKKRGLLTGRK